jgi:hypothetical protein
MSAIRPARNHPWRKSMPAWSHNVQLVRLWMPPQMDAPHHKSLVAFDKDLQKLLVTHFGNSAISSYIGFYRSNHDWDNIETPNACINNPLRGSNKDGVDNEP